jgi:hypothetical protein
VDIGGCCEAGVVSKLGPLRSRAAPVPPGEAPQAGVAKSGPRVVAAAEGPHEEGRTQEGVVQHCHVAPRFRLAGRAAGAGLPLEAGHPGGASL